MGKPVTMSEYFSMCDTCGKIISYRRLCHFTRKVRVRCQKCFLDKYYNPNWKGTQVGYTALHNYIKRHKPKPVVCEICEFNVPRDLHNINKKYLRNINDFQWLCKSCHMKEEYKNRR